MINQSKSNIALKQLKTVTGILALSAFMLVSLQLSGCNSSQAASPKLKILVAR